MTIELEEIPGKGENLRKNLETGICKVHLREKKLSSLNHTVDIKQLQQEKRMKEDVQNIIQNQTEVPVHDAKGNNGMLNIFKHGPCMI